MAGNKRRVVVTGMATINPLGDTLDGYFDNLVKGKSGIRRWTSLDLSQVECKVGGDLGDYDCDAALAAMKDRLSEPLHKKLRKLFRTCTFSNKMTVLTALNAALQAGLFASPGDPFRTSVLVGGHNFNSKYITANTDQFRVEPAYIEALFGIEALDPNIAATVSEVLSVNGPTFTLGGACASGNLALRDGFRDIVSGECDRSVVCGAVFDMTAADIHAMATLSSVVLDAELQADPTKASRPFDVRRCGFVPSHGAGTIILEERGSALARGATVLAELLGVRANANANHLPAPSSGFQAVLIKSLLADAGVRPEQVEYVNCHATSTPLGDLEEIQALKTAFGPHYKKLKVNAPKSMLGHVCWSAPIVEAIGGILQMNRGVLHPSINVDEQDPEIDLDVCANSPREMKFDYMLKNSFGFGGINCCALFKRHEG